MIGSYPPAIRRQLLSKHFLISTMPEGALDDLVKFTTVARFEPHRVIFSKGDKGDCLYGILSGRVRSTPLPRFAADSPLEQSGFEPLVPLTPKRGRCRFARNSDVSATPHHKQSLERLVTAHT